MDDDITALLAEIQNGGKEASEALYRSIYDELHRLAERHHGAERAGHTLQPTALVNEAYLKLVGQRESSWRNRAHFLAIASIAMRRILLHHAERRRAVKRGAQWEAVPLDEVVALHEERSGDLLEMDQVLQRLAEVDARKARLVELHFFGGLSFAEIAEVLEVSPRTVERDWRVARAWLRAALEEAAA